MGMFAVNVRASNRLRGTIARLTVLPTPEPVEQHEDPGSKSKRAVHQQGVIHRLLSFEPKGKYHQRQPDRTTGGNPPPRHCDSSDRLAKHLGSRAIVGEFAQHCRQIAAVVAVSIVPSSVPRQPKREACPQGISNESEFSAREYAVSAAPRRREFGRSERKGRI
jgi:hypothetical protein